MSEPLNKGRIEQNQPWLRSVETILQKAAGEGRNQLFEYEVYEILAELRIPTPTYIMARDERDITHSNLAVFSSERSPTSRKPAASRSSTKTWIS